MLPDFLISFIKTILRHLLEITFNGKPFRDWINWNLIYCFRKFQIAHIGNMSGIK